LRFWQVKTLIWMGLPGLWGGNKIAPYTTPFSARRFAPVEYVTFNKMFAAFALVAILLTVLTASPATATTITYKFPTGASFALVSPPTSFNDVQISGTFVYDTSSGAVTMSNISLSNVGPYSGLYSDITNDHNSPPYTNLTVYDPGVAHLALLFSPQLGGSSPELISANLSAARINSTSPQLDIALQQVPEPSSFGLIFAGMLAVLASRRFCDRQRRWAE
jgi:PEP-CTERM motif